jgi:signal peptide peptidase SppA
METISLDAPKASIPFVNCWFGEWAMDERYFGQMQQQLQSLNLNLHLAGTQENRQQALDRIDDSFSTTQEGIGIVCLNGPLMKHASSFSESCSTVAARREIHRMTNDPNIRGICLKIESPGGTVAGTNELARAVAEANAKKPTMAYCSDLTASAAYWIASQCGTIEASETTFVGSIGTYCVVMDSSAAADKIGVKVHVVRAGDFKGMGTAGTEITEDQLSEMRSHVYGLNQFFLDAVSNGRKMEMAEVSKLADGRVHLAKDAKSLGLIDKVSSFEDAFDRFAKSCSFSPSSRIVSTQEENDMSATENTVKPVTLAELESKFPKASAEWKIACLKGGFTMEQCTLSHCEILQLEVDAANKRAEIAEARANKPGVQPLKSKSSSPMKKDSEDDMPELDEEDAKSVWDQKFAAELKACGGNRQRAASQCNKKNPGLRELMVQQANAMAGRRIR